MSVPATRVEKRSLGRAMMRGAGCRCPHCGQGRIFRAYLKVVSHCDACGEEFHHHRADDLPAYVAIFIVGHVVIGIMVHLDMAWRVPPMTYLATMIPLAIVLSLATLPAIKGTIVGLQWALRMHGFDPYHREKAGQ